MRPCDASGELYAHIVWPRATDGELPQLVGVAYTAQPRPGEPYSDFPAGQGAWHDRNGSGDEEVLPVSHGGSSHPGGDIRLAVMHAWLWSENPRGLWTAENWALPFVQAGLCHDSAGVPASAALAMRGSPRRG